LHNLGSISRKGWTGMLALFLVWVGGFIIGGVVGFRIALAIGEHYEHG